MPGLFRTLAASSKRSLAFVDRAASRILNTLQRGAPALQHEDTPPTDVSSIIPPLPDNIDNINEEAIPTPILLADNASSDSSQEPSDFDDDVTDKSGDDSTDDRHAEVRATPSVSEGRAENADSEPATVSTHPQPDEATEAPVTIATPSRVQVRSYPYHYAAAPFARRSAANIQTHNDTSHIRSRREFFLPRTQSEGAVPETRVVTGCPLSQNDEASAHSTLSGECSTSHAGCSGPSRGRKRSREPEHDFDEGESSSEISRRRPRTRRRLSNPHPRCTRDTCLARNLHVLDFDGPSCPRSNDEGAWSHTAQASDSECDPASRRVYSQMIEDWHRRRTCRKRGRDHDTDPDSIEEAGPSRKRRREGNQ
ncbi:hypothetical protein C8Q79DRAFT_978046 [Trametes meyenii]|nr:hypothetical protein C8Q79DRAFT_978046 [Trametes meyenii]